MAVRRLGDRVNSRDLETARKSINPPKFEEGFDKDPFSDLDDDGDDDAPDDDLFSSSFRRPMSREFGAGSSRFGSREFGAGASRFGATGSQQNSNKSEDKAAEYFSSLWSVIKSAFKSLKLRTFDDLSDYGRVGAITSGVVAFIGVGISLISLIGGLGVGSLATGFILTGLSSLSLALISIGVGGFFSKQDQVTDTEEDLENLSINLFNEQGGDFSDDDDLFTGNTDEDEDFLFDTTPFSSLDDTEDEEDEEDDSDPLSFTPNSYEDEEEEDEEDEEEELSFSSLFTEQRKEVDIDTKVANIPENIPILNRKYLYDLFIDLYPKYTPEFNKREVLDKDSEEFLNLSVLSIKALANARKKSYEETAEATSLTEVVSTLYTYELTLTRIQGLNNLKDISNEVTAYFRENHEDMSVSAEAKMDGDSYKIIVNKGYKALVSLGDVLSVDTNQKHFKDPKNLLPIVAGIKPNGNCLLVDLKDFESLLIAGKSRSGKSWYVLQFLLPLLTFCVPSDVQFLIVDPKETVLFQKISRFPHVCGLHSGKKESGTNILEILTDLIEKEGASRKKLFQEHDVDTIWELRGKGVELPVLMVVIDEVITLTESLTKEESSLFTSLVKTVVTQLPSLGIKLLLVPHRAQGIIDKTVRTNMAYACAIRADNEIVKETLDTKNWNFPLLNPGDLALRYTGLPEPMFVRSPAVTDSEESNKQFLDNAIRLWEKLNPTVPNMETLGRAYNKDILYLQNSNSLGTALKSLREV